MKKLMMAWIVVLFALATDAQSFKKGDMVEVDKNFSSDGNMSWIKGRVIDIEIEKKNYIVKGADRKNYNIPFTKEESWIRKPAQSHANRVIVANDSTNNCFASPEIVKQKIREDFAEEFSQYDTVVITYNGITALESYKNTDVEFGMVNTSIYPYNVDFTVRLVSTSKDGVQKTLNWQFKRKYLVFQNLKGLCDMTLADKEESLLSHI